MDPTTSLTTDDIDALDDVDLIVTYDDTTIITFPSKDSLLNTLLLNIYDLQNSNSSSFCDTLVRCSDGDVRIPSILLAATSPVFKIIAGAAFNDSENFSLILPDLNLHDFNIFIKHLCLLRRNTEQSEKLLEDMEAIERVISMIGAEFKGSEDEMDSLLLLDHDWTQISMDHVKKRRGRKKKEVKSDPEPYVKTEVLDMVRQETSYTLRQKIKRKRFADEVSDPPSDLDEEDQDLSSEAGSDDYRPVEDDHEEDEDEIIEEEEEESDKDVEEGEDPMTMYTVRMGQDGQLEVLNDEDKMSMDAEVQDALGQIVTTVIGDEVVFKEKKKKKKPAANPRSLLKSKKRRLLKSKNRKRKESFLVECPKCGKEKREGPSFKLHLKRCGQGTSRVKCTECDMEFKRKEDMQAHALIHLGSITCPIHNIMFKQEIEVFHHVNQADPGDKVPKLQCCMCSSHFRHMCLFMKHMRRHLQILAYRCGVCKKHFNTYASLQVHQQNIHGVSDAAVATERMFNCDQCSKSFNTKGHLKEHMLGVHDRSNMVSCPACQKTFTTHKRMKKHLFNSHKEMAEQFRRNSKVEVFPDSSVRIFEGGEEDVEIIVQE